MKKTRLNFEIECPKNFAEVLEALPYGAEELVNLSIQWQMYEADCWFSVIVRTVDEFHPANIRAFKSEFDEALKDVSIGGNGDFQSPTPSK